MQNEKAMLKIIRAMKILHGPNFLNKYLLPSFHHKPLAVSDVIAGTGGGALQGAAGHVVEDGGLLLVDDKCESLGKIILVAIFMKKLHAYKYITKKTIKGRNWKEIWIKWKEFFVNSFNPQGICRVFLILTPPLPLPYDGRGVPYRLYRYLLPAL